MSKIVILGDTHLGVGSSSDHFHKYFAKSFSHMFEYMLDNDIHTIIQTGDMYDRRREVHFNTLYQTKIYFFDRLVAQDITVFVMCGNHDSLYKSSNHINSITLLKHDNVIPVDMEPRTYSIEGISIDLYPWVNESNLNASLKFCSESSSKIAVGHFEFANFPMHRGSMAEDGMDHKLFSKYDKIISGHYHTQSEQDNVQYTGTPYELTWIDHDDPKGFWVFDTETQNMEFIRNPYTLYAKISYTDDMYDSFDYASVSDKFVKVFVTDKETSKKLQKFVDKLLAQKPIDVKVVDNIIVESVSTALGSTKSLTSTQDMIESVVENMDVSIDKQKLKRYVLDTYSEALSISNAL